MYCRNFAVLSSFFDIKKQRPTMNLEKCYHCSANIEISLDLKVYFSLVTCKINNLIALRSTNQITESSAPWWLILICQSYSVILYTFSIFFIFLPFFYWYHFLTFLMCSEKMKAKYIKEYVRKSFFINLN